MQVLDLLMVIHDFPIEVFMKSLSSLNNNLDYATWLHKSTMEESSRSTISIALQIPYIFFSYTRLETMDGIYNQSKSKDKVWMSQEIQHHLQTE